MSRHTKMDPKWTRYFELIQKARQAGYNGTVARRMAWERTFGREAIQTVSELPKTELTDGVVGSTEIETVSD